MNIRDLQYFIAVADVQHFGRAAQDCHVSQPTLSAQLKKLETTFGVMLLERTHKHVSLTEAGKALLPYAKRVISQVDEMKEAVTALQNPRAGRLRIGLIPTIAPYLLSSLTPKLYQKLPDVQWYFSEYQTEAGVERLLAGELDAMIMAKLKPVPNTLTLSMGHEEFLVAVSDQHPLAKQKQVTMHDIEQENLLLLGEGHCLREQTTDFCRFLKTRPQKFAGTSLETLRQMVAVNVGVSVMPAMACVPTQGIVYRPIADVKPGREIILLCRDTYPKIDILKDIQQLGLVHD